LNERGGQLAALNYEGWSCTHELSRFGAVTEVWEEQENGRSVDEQKGLRSLI
jgi:hypothetical protein